MPLVIQLFGAVQVMWNDVPLRFATEHARALLAYLAVEADVAHQRTTLATLLWPEENEANARHNLRQALSFLKRTLGDVAGRDTLLHITPTTLQWNRQGVKLDFHTFQQLWQRSQTHSHADLGQCATCIEAFTQAVALYQGEFLQGLLLKASQPFEEWALFLREQTHRRAMEMLALLTTHHWARGAYDQAQHYATRMVTLEPWHEAGQRQLMQALAAQGQASAALRQYENCQRILQSELGVAPSPETTRLYERIRTGEFAKALVRKVAENHPLPPSAVRLAPPPPARLHNLPAFLPPLVGYTEPLVQLRTLISQPTQRLITIVGMGGMGKTRLALALLEQVVAEAPSAFTDGYWFVPLVGVPAAITDLPSALAGAILNVLAANAPQQENLVATLFHYLAQRQLLLVLDNLEHLLLEERTAAATIEFLLGLLQAAPGVKLLTTSRHPLQLVAEAVVRLDGLPVPDVRLADKVAEESNYASLRLFVYHAQRTLPSFALNQANQAAVSELCRQLGGMPLAIELAATLTPHFAIDELVTAIRQNLTLLASKRRDLDVRHRHFHVLLESAWQQLTVDEQTILAQSAIFVGRFSRAAAQAVTGATIAELSTLVDRSLIQQPAVGEYQLHPLLRQFANSRLQEQPDEAQLRIANQHSRYYLDFVLARAEVMARHDPRRAVAEIQHEFDNVRQAWQWTATTLSTELWRRLDAVAYPLWQFYLLTFRYEEGFTAFQHTIIGVQKMVGDIPEQNGQAERASNERRQWEQLLSKFLGLQAMLLSIGGKYQKALPLAEKAREMGLAQGGRDGEILGLNGLVIIHYSNGHWACAQCCAEQLLSRAQSLSSEIGYSAQVMAYIYLGAIARWADDYPQATQHFHCALQLCQALGKLMGGMDARMNLADVARCKQNYAIARLEYEQVLQTACALGNLRAEGVARYELADVQRGLGEYSVALAQFTRALALFHEVGDPVLESYALSSLSICYTHLGDQERAQAFCEQALHHSAALTMSEAQSFVWLAAAIAYHQCGDNEQALAYAIRSQQDALRQQSRRAEAVALLHVGLACEGLRLWIEATNAYQQAHHLYQKLDILPSRCEAEAGLARVALVQGNLADAVTWAEQTLASLPNQANVGLYEPFLIYLTLYHVLRANADPRTSTILQTGVQELQRYAEQITASELRRSFLESVPIHQALHNAYLATVDTALTAD